MRAKKQLDKGVQPNIVTQARMKKFHSSSLETSDTDLVVRKSIHIAVYLDGAGTICYLECLYT